MTVAMLQIKKATLTVTIIVILLILTACNSVELVYSSFDPSAEGLVQIATKRPYYNHDNQPDKLSLVVASRGRIKPCEPFIADEWQVYHVPSECFRSYSDHEKNTVVNQLVHIPSAYTKNKSDEEIAIMKGIFEQIANLEHELMTVEIMNVDEEYFVYVELNVNLWTPCTLYYYSQEESRLVELRRFDNRSVTGIHILSKERLHRLR